MLIWRDLGEGSVVWYGIKMVIYLSRPEVLGGNQYVSAIGLTWERLCSSRKSYLNRFLTMDTFHDTIAQGWGTLLCSTAGVISSNVLWLDCPASYAITWVITVTE